MLETANLYKEPKDQELSKTPESIDDIMENLILEIHSHSISSINIPVNSDSLIAHQKTNSAKQSETIISPTKVRF